MNWESRQEKIFFGTIHELTQDNPNKRLSEGEIISKMPKLNPIKAKELFDRFSSPNFKYIEEDGSGEYRISDAGMVYYEQLYAEWETADLQIELGKSSLSTNRTVKITAWVAVVFAILTAIISYLQYAKEDPKCEVLQKEEKNTQEVQQPTEIKSNSTHHVLPSDSTDSLKK